MIRLVLFSATLCSVIGTMNGASAAADQEPDAARKCVEHFYDNAYIERRTGDSLTYYMVCSEPHAGRYRLSLETLVKSGNNRRTPKVGTEIFPGKCLVSNVCHLDLGKYRKVPFAEIAVDADKLAELQFLGKKAELYGNDAEFLKEIQLHVPKGAQVAPEAPAALAPLRGPLQRRDSFLRRSLSLVRGKR